VTNMDEVLQLPPVAAAIFLVIACMIYQLGRWVSPEGHYEPDKHLPYTGGELPLSVPTQHSYRAFFRLALFFSILHIGALVLSTTPGDVRLRRLAIVYLAGIAISVYALSQQEE